MVVNNLGMYNVNSGRDLFSDVYGLLSKFFAKSPGGGTSFNLGGNAAQPGVGTAFQTPYIPQWQPPANPQGSPFWRTPMNPLAGLGAQQIAQPQPQMQPQQISIKFPAPAAAAGGTVGKTPKKSVATSSPGLNNTYPSVPTNQVSPAAQPQGFVDPRVQAATTSTRGMALQGGMYSPQGGQMQQPMVNPGQMSSIYGQKGPSIWQNPGFLYMLAKMGAAISPEGTIGQRLGETTAEINQQQAIANYEKQGAFTGPLTPQQERFNRLNNMAIPYPIRSEMADKEFARKMAGEELELGKRRVAVSEKGLTQEKDLAEAEHKFKAGLAEKEFGWAKDLQEMRNKAEEQRIKLEDQLKRQFQKDSLGRALSPDEKETMAKILQAADVEAKQVAAETVLSFLLEMGYAPGKGLTANDLIDPFSSDPESGERSEAWKSLTDKDKRQAIRNFTDELQKVRPVIYEKYGLSWRAYAQ